MFYLVKQKLLDYAKTLLQFRSSKREPHLTQQQLRDQLLANEIKQAAHLTPKERASLMRRNIGRKY